jgi:electron transport complex protein RnfB
MGNHTNDSGITDMRDVYKRLAAFLDRLPAGYPRTESGVELRILRRLFTEEQAALFMHLTLLGEEARVIAQRAKLPVETVNQMLDEMDMKGLIYSSSRPGSTKRYLANQFVVGFWEGQVNRLDRELVEDFEQYIDTFTNVELWRKAPQLRTIPVGESIPIQAGAMPYEIAEKIIDANSTFAVAICICRQEQRMLGKGCGKLLEACLSFGSAAEHDVAVGRGRKISREEALAILKQADEAGLVLQPGNSKKPGFICACCGDCCGVLRQIKLHPHPASYISSPYIVSHDDAICSGCGTCIERCQMEAISIPDGVAQVNPERCIGCGLCVTTCSTGAMSLVRKPEAEQKVIPKNTSATYVQLAQARGFPYFLNLLIMAVKSRIGHLTSRV